MKITGTPHIHFGITKHLKGIIMSELELIAQRFEIDGKMNSVHFAISEDVWLNATEVANLHKRDIKFYWKNKTTKEYILSLEKYSNTVEKYPFKKVIKGKYGGTYIHPDLVLHFARWCSSDFAVQCDMYLKSSIQKEIIEGKEEIHQLMIDLDNAKELKTYRGGLISLRKYLKGKDMKEEDAWEILVASGKIYNAYPTVLKRMLNDERVGKQPKGKAPIFYPEFLDDIFFSTSPLL